MGTSHLVHAFFFLKKCQAASAAGDLLFSGPVGLHEQLLLLAFHFASVICQMKISKNEKGN